MQQVAPKPKASDGGNNTNIYHCVTLSKNPPTPQEGPKANDGEEFDGDDDGYDVVKFRYTESRGGCR
eukprot:11812101-Karenia_brevis.AAC.1